MGSTCLSARLVLFEVPATVAGRCEQCSVKVSGLLSFDCPLCGTELRDVRTSYADGVGREKRERGKGLKAKPTGLATVCELCENIFADYDGLRLTIGKRLIRVCPECFKKTDKLEDAECFEDKYLYGRDALEHSKFLKSRDKK